MKFIQCPDCKKEISTRETKCPYCGKFILGYYKMSPLMQKVFKIMVVPVGILLLLLLFAVFVPEEKQEVKQVAKEETAQLNAEQIEAPVAEEVIDETPFREALQKASQRVVKDKYGPVTIELDLKNDMYRAWFIYKKDPIPMYTAETLSRLGVKTIIDELMRQGHDPNKESISIFTRVHTIPVEKSVTGKDQVRTYGVASYDYLYDKIEWKQAE
ncbi:MAG: zinc ribbon domain-containing protein [Desulfitobacteriaceae bacterium]|nr:zinc ribbon domain-containing protein [Desulfitobacteriaceae bacterium]